MTCIYGLIFVVLGNLTGNAIACGQYIMQAAGAPDHPQAVRGLAVAILPGACLIHGLWRHGGIVLNNVLASIKVLTLVAVIVIGFATAEGASFGNGPEGKSPSKEISLLLSLSLAQIATQEAMHGPSSISCIVIAGSTANLRESRQLSEFLYRHANLGWCLVGIERSLASKKKIR